MTSQDLRSNLPPVVLARCRECDKACQVPRRELMRTAPAKCECGGVLEAAEAMFRAGRNAKQSKKPNFWETT